MKWKRVNHGNINVPIKDYLEELIKEEEKLGNKLKVAIGTDSQKHGKSYKFATVILLMRHISMGYDKSGKEITKGLGGMVIGTTFWKEMKASTYQRKHREIEVLNERMMIEVSSSLEIAYELKPLFDSYGIPIEIHADINPSEEKGLSNIALNSAVGYIMGMGFDFKIKPDSYAASSCADKLC